MEPREPAAVRYRLEIDHARHVERALQWLGWTVAVLATTGRLTGGQAVGASLGARDLPDSHQPRAGES